MTAEDNSFLYHYSDSQSVAMTQAVLAFAEDVNARYGTFYRHNATAGQYHLMEMPEYGDISSGNVTGITYWIWQKFTEDENAQRALAHELVHPYVAVPVARNDSLYCLAIEGFPSYFHLPILAQRLGDDFYDRFLGWMERLYLDKRATGTDRRGNKVPPEKPLLAIAADELSTYKDEFVLSDRALLFLNYLYAEMGEKKFFMFTSDLFGRARLTTQNLLDLIQEYLPNSREGVNIWLSTTDYPEQLHFKHFMRKSRQ